MFRFYKAMHTKWYKRIKGFRAELHGITNLPFFYRVCKIYG